MCIRDRSFPASTKGRLHKENYVGKRLDGRYEIQEIIGVGGMAVVYKAYDNIDDRIVCLLYTA